MSPAIQAPGTGHFDQRSRSHQRQMLDNLERLQPEMPHSARLRPSESWIDISSHQTSSTTLASAANDITTSNLRVQHDSNTHRRRRRVLDNALYLNLTRRRPSGDCSSQEEYDESESESDRVMTSSNEGLAPGPVISADRDGHLEGSSEHTEEEDDDETDENATAIGVPSNLQCFTPQPNAFSHPPSSSHPRPPRDSVPGSYFPPASRPSARSSAARHSYPAQQTRQIPNQSHTPYNMISPSHQVDHDAALRASLSTLLSCAAAARGLPKPSHATSTSHRPHGASSTRVDPSTLRIVPESAILGTRHATASPTRTRMQKHVSAGTSSSREASPTPALTLDKGKRKAVARSTSKERHVVKKPRRASSNALDEGISPTLLTWLTAAGVVVLVSALSFSTGYVIGREAGRVEGRGFGCGEGGKGGLGLRRLAIVGA